MQYITYEQQGCVGVITIDRQPALNALNCEVLKELEQTFASVDYKSCRCIVLTGAGKRAFVAGADIGEMEPMTREQAAALGELGNRVFRMVETLPVPVVAAVNGYALGGGCELAMACDIRIASDNAVFGQPEVSLGITPGFGGTQRLPRIVGYGVAKELLYTAEKISAARALEIGLVNKVVPSDGLMKEAMRLASKIARNAPIAVQAVKSAITGGVEVDMDSAIAVEIPRFASCFETADQHNAMSAYLEKRKPDPFINK